MTDFLVGIDVGTSRLKVGVFDAVGNLHAFAEHPCPVQHQGNEEIVIDPDVWWEALDASMQDCLHEVNADEIRGIGVSSQAQTYVWLGNEGRAKAEAISWLDQRGDSEGIETELKEFDFYAHTGWDNADPMLAVCKLKAGIGCPSTLRDEHTLVFTDGYMIQRLTGTPAVSRNLAAMSGLYSLRENDWWDKSIQCVGLTRNNLPIIHEIGQPVARLKNDLARRWDMPQVPVMAGANDQTTAALGAGLSGPGDTALCLGTAFVAYQVISRGTPAPSVRPIRGAYAGGLGYQLTLHNTAGGVVEWARRIFRDNSPWEELFEMAFSAPPGARGVRCCPDFSSTDGGMLSGMKLQHKPGDVLRGVLEGVAMAARQKLMELNAPKTIVATGSATSNDRWMKLMADVTHRTIITLEQSQATLWGTALAAGTGAGVFQDILRAAPGRRMEKHRFRPNENLSGFYDELFVEQL